MTYNNIQYPRPTVYLIPEAWVEHKGDEYRFWAEKDLRDGELTVEFLDGEPTAESFNWTQLYKDVEYMFSDYEGFCGDHGVEPEEYIMGEMGSDVPPKEGV